MSLRIGSLRGPGGLKGLESIPGLLDEPEEAKPPIQKRIPLWRRGLLGPRRPDPLENAALQNVAGTLPERIVWKWLIEQGRNFITQNPELGGRLTIGGAIVDFVVYDMAPSPVVLRVQGDYWHGPMRPGVQRRDDEQALRLRNQGYIVVDLWESDIYQAVIFERLGDYISEQIGGGL